MFPIGAPWFLGPEKFFFQGLILGVWNLSYLEDVSEPELATQSPNWIKFLPNFRFTLWGPFFNPVRVLLRRERQKLNNQVIAALKSFNRFSSLRVGGLRFGSHRTSQWHRPIWAKSLSMGWCDVAERRRCFSYEWLRRDWEMKHVALSHLIFSLRTTRALLVQRCCFRMHPKASNGAQRCLNMLDICVLPLVVVAGTHIRRSSRQQPQIDPSAFSHASIHIWSLGAQGED